MDEQRRPQANDNRFTSHLTQRAHLTSRDIEDARRLLNILAGAPPNSGCHDMPADEGNPFAEDGSLRTRARRFYEARQKRLQYFDTHMFGEPAWDMLLVLYFHEGGERQSPKGLTEFSGTSRSSAIRWIHYLEEEGLVEIQDHPTDLRRSFIEITDKSRNLLERYLSDRL